MKYNSEILIRNFKIHLLTGEEMDYKIQIIFEHLESHFKHLKLIKYKDSDMGCIVDSLGNVKFIKSIFTDNIMMCDDFTKTIYLNNYDYKDLSSLISVYLQYRFPNFHSELGFDMDLIYAQMDFYLNNTLNIKHYR